MYRISLRRSAQGHGNNYPQKLQNMLVIAFLNTLQNFSDLGSSVIVEQSLKPVDVNVIVEMKKKKEENSALDCYQIFVFEITLFSSIGGLVSTTPWPFSHLAVYACMKYC